MGDVASLVTPYIQSNANDTCMVFYYHLYGHSIGSLRVKVGDQVLWQLSGNQGNSWYKATVPLNFDGTYKVLTMLLLLTVFTRDSVKVRYKNEDGDTKCHPRNE